MTNLSQRFFSRIISLSHTLILISIFGAQVAAALPPSARPLYFYTLFTNGLPQPQPQFSSGEAAKNYDYDLGMTEYKKCVPRLWGEEAGPSECGYAVYGDVIYAPYRGDGMVWGWDVLENWVTKREYFTYLGATVTVQTGFGYVKRNNRWPYCPSPYTAVRSINGWKIIESCELPPRPDDNCTVDGNPINFISGDKVEEVTDYTSSNGLILRRKYLSQRRGWIIAPVPKLSDFRPSNTAKTIAACTGESLTTPLSTPDPTAPYTASTISVPTVVCLEPLIAPTALVLQTPDGFPIEFKEVDPSLFAPTNGFSRLKIIDPTQNNGRSYVLETTKGARQYFNANGLLVYEEFGMTKLAYSYVDNRLQSITDSKGRSISFNYEQGQIVSAQTPDGLVTYEYKKVGPLFIPGAISQIRLMDGSTQYYKYDDVRFPLALTASGIVGQGDYGSWKYNDLGQAVESSHPNGADKFTFDYSGLNSKLAASGLGKVSVTNSLGKKTIYTVAELNGVSKVTGVQGLASQNCAGANKAYEYYPTGGIKKQTDWNGNQTSFLYDNQNRETSRTSAFGTPVAQTTQTCWHPSLNQRSRVIEATKVTLFDYWPNGLLKSQTIKPRPAGAVDCTTAL